MLFCFVYEFINMFILFSRPTVYLTMMSYLCVGLLITINTIYYTKIVGEDKENVLNHVFDGDYIPKLKDSNYEIGEKKTMEKLKNDPESEFKEDFSYKLAETFYIIVRGVYACIIFYFVPYMYLFVAYSYSMAQVYN